MGLCEVLYNIYRLVVKQNSLCLASGSFSWVPNISKGEQEFELTENSYVGLLFSCSLTFSRELKEDTRCARRLPQARLNSKDESPALGLVLPGFSLLLPLWTHVESLPAPRSPACVTQRIMGACQRGQTNAKQTCLHNLHYLYHSSM